MSSRGYTIRGLRTDAFIKADGAILEDDDKCGEAQFVHGCFVQVSCQTCLEREGCAVESTTGKCVSVSRISNSTTGAEYFKSGSVNYCNADDAACAPCESGGDQSVCRGADSCICVQECTGRSDTVIDCPSLRITNWLYLLLVLAFLAPLCIYIYMRRDRLRQRGVCCFREGQQVDPRPNSNSAAPALKLDGWRHFIQGHTESFDHVELKSCPAAVQDPCDPYYRRSDRGRRTEDGDFESSGEEGLRQDTSEGYVTCTTPTSSRGPSQLV